jgi:hypothetical protein
MLPPRRYRRAIPDRWLGVLPFLARPEARHVLVVGLGAGTALEAVPASLADVDVVELEPRVIEANARFRERRAVDPLAVPAPPPRNDARGALALTTKRYDIVVSSRRTVDGGGVALYTASSSPVASRPPDGVRAVDRSRSRRPPLFASLLATLLDTYAHVGCTGRSSAVRRSSSPRTRRCGPRPRGPRARRRAGRAARAGVQTREDVAAALRSTTRARGARRAPLTTDDRNLLESRTMRHHPLGYRGPTISAELDPLPAPSARSIVCTSSAGCSRIGLSAGRRVAALGDPSSARPLPASSRSRPSGRRTGASLRSALAEDRTRGAGRVAARRTDAAPRGRRRDDRARRATRRAGARRGRRLGRDAPATPRFGRSSRVSPPRVPATRSATRPPACGVADREPSRSRRRGALPRSAR